MNGFKLSVRKRGGGGLFRFVFAVAGALSLLSAEPAHAQRRAQAVQTVERGVDVRSVVSPGGIEAWLVSDATVPIIVLRAYWKGGSASEPAGLTGVTGVMADMMTEGSGDLDANAWKERIQTLNMSLGFSAGWDGVGMSMTTLSENRDAAFDMARRALSSPRFDAAPLARIKRQLEVGIRQRETNPGYIANLALDNATIPGHPYARRAELATVNAIDRAGLAARRNALLARSNLLVTVVGDIDAATLAPLLDSTFGVLPREAQPQPPIPVAEVRAGQPLVVRQLPQPQSLVLFAAPGIQDEDPDWVPLAVANYILGGGGFSSRLMTEVREKCGFVYGISTGPSIRDWSALIRGAAQTENDKVVQAIETTRAEIARFYEQGPTQAEVNDAITYLTGSFALDLDSNVKIAGMVHAYQVAGRPIDYINRRNALIRAVTLADVNRVIRRLYDPAKFTFVVVGQPVNLATQ